MHDHSWIFWVVVPFLFFMFVRRSRYWGHPESGHRRMKRSLQKKVRAGAGLETGELDHRQDEELVEHRHYIDELEKRVAELENRLDFTERLLTERRESVMGGS